MAAKREDDLKAKADMAMKRAEAVEAKTKPRQITADQKKQLLDLLVKGPKGPASVRSDFFDVEASQYAHQLSDVLKEAGFEIQEYKQTSSDGKGGVTLTIGQAGVFILAKDISNVPAHAASVQSCFSQVGITMPGMNAAWLQCESNCIVIWVGARP